MKYIIYISTPGDQQLKVLQINSNLDLEIIQIIKTCGEAQPITAIKNILYVGIRPNFHISTYKINCTGKLEKIGESPIPGSPNYLSVDKTNNFLFCASYAQNLLSVSQIDQFGIPGAPLQILYNIEGCHYCSVDYNNNILFVTALKKNCIYLYNVNKFGNITKNKQHILHTKKGLGPRHITFHPNKKYAYNINELNSTIDVWKLNSKKIELIQNISILPSLFHGIPWGSDIHIHPFGNYLYACDRNSSTITSLKIRPSSNTLYDAQYTITEKQPRAFFISHDGKYLIVAGELSNYITLYSISENSCILKKIRKIFIGERPIWVYIHTML